MLRQANTDELLDGPLDDLAVLRGNLRDLRRINRLLGGAELSVRAIERLLDGMSGEATLLDVGTGAADIPMRLLRRPRSALRLLVVAADSRPEVLAAARTLDPALDAPGGPTLIVADGRRLPWPNACFDVAHSSLVLHHLEPDEAIAFLKELRRICRRGVVVNDLVRGRGWWLLALIGSRLLTGNRLTRNDAPLSVRRAYTVSEARDLLIAAGLRPTGVAMGPLGHRFGITAVPA